MALPTPEEVQAMMDAEQASTPAPQVGALPSPEEVQAMMDADSNKYGSITATPDKYSNPIANFYEQNISGPIIDNYIKPVGPESSIAEGLAKGIVKAGIRAPATGVQGVGDVMKMIGNPIDTVGAISDRVKNQSAAQTGADAVGVLGPIAAIAGQPWALGAGPLAREMANQSDEARGLRPETPGAAEAGMFGEDLTNNAVLTYGAKAIPAATGVNKLASTVLAKRAAKYSSNVQKSMWGAVKTTIDEYAPKIGLRAEDLLKRAETYVRQVKDPKELESVIASHRNDVGEMISTSARELDGLEGKSISWAEDIAPTLEEARKGALKDHWNFETNQPKSTLGTRLNNEFNTAVDTLKQSFFPEEMAMTEVDATRRLREVSKEKAQIESAQGGKKRDPRNQNPRMASLIAEEDELVSILSKINQMKKNLNLGFSDLRDSRIMFDDLASAAYNSPAEGGATAAELHRKIADAFRESVNMKAQSLGEKFPNSAASAEAFSAANHEYSFLSDFYPAARKVSKRAMDEESAAMTKGGVLSTALNLTGVKPILKYVANQTLIDKVPNVTEHYARAFDLLNRKGPNPSGAITPEGRLGTGVANAGIWAGMQAAPGAAAAVAIDQMPRDPSALLSEDGKKQILGRLIIEGYKEQGLDGHPIDQIPQETRDRIEMDAEEKMADISALAERGNASKTRQAFYQISQLYPGIFKKSATGYTSEVGKGESTYILDPLEQDDAKTYISKSNASVTEKAKAVSALNRSGQVTSQARSILGR